MAAKDGPNAGSSFAPNIDEQAGDSAGAEAKDDLLLPRLSHAQILAQQEQERKDFRKRVDRIRSSIPKKDRAGRARAAEGAAEDEKRLLEAQAAERLENDIPDEMVIAEVAAPTASAGGGQQGGGAKSESKAARRKRKKAEQETESRRRVEAEKASMGPSPKFLETAAIEAQLKPKSMRIQAVAADGHCLYSAVAHQMIINDLPSPVSASVAGLRNVTADFLMSHKNDYMPFLETVNGDDELFKKYCDELRNEAVWGGQVELKAMAEILGTEIEVYAADMPVVKMGQRADGAPILRISFHRQYLGLGEHYNSIVPRT